MTTLVPKYDQGATEAVNRPFNQKLQEIVSVKDFGAVGDGVADDTVAIQAAIDYVGGSTYPTSSTSGALFFPKGIYNVTDALIVNYKVSFYGEGLAELSYGSRLVQKTNNKDLIKINPTVSGNTSLSIENMSLYSDAGVGTGHLVNTIKTSDGTVNSQKYTGCVFAQPQAMALMLAGDDISVLNCTFDVSQQSGNMIQLGTATKFATNVRIIGNDFFNATNSILNLIQSKNVVFNGNNVSQPNDNTKTPFIIDAYTSAVFNQNIEINGNIIQGARTFFKCTTINNVIISANNVILSGAGTGETQNLIDITGTCVGLNISDNIFRGAYGTTAYFYSDSTATYVDGVIANNSFLNDGDASNPCLSAIKFTGRFLANYYGGFTAQQLGQKTANKNNPVNPGTITAGSLFSYAITVNSATFGDNVTVGTLSNAWCAQTGIEIVSFINTTNAVRVEYRNVTGSSITIAAHNIWSEVTR